MTHFSSRPLTLPEVFSALAYHYDHPDELEAYIERGRCKRVKSCESNT